MSTGTYLPAEGGGDLNRYLHVSNAMESTRSQLDELEQTEAVGVFKKQMDLLRRRLLNEPTAFRDMFINDGANALVWEFKQDELSAAFVRTM